jgi:hypothetical protein
MAKALRVTPSARRVDGAELVVAGVDAVPDHGARIVRPAGHASPRSAMARSAQAIIAAVLWAQLAGNVFAPAGQSQVTPSGHAVTT